jgi:hypothetical protein
MQIGMEKCMKESERVDNGLPVISTFNSPKSFTLHGKMIVSPITALYKCPFVMNFGTGVGPVVSLDEYISALF